MPHILKRKVKNVIYIYEETSYRDKQGRPRTKQKYLGKLDKDGILIASRKRLREKNLPAAIMVYKITIKKFNLKPITRNSREYRNFTRHHDKMRSNKNFKGVSQNCISSMVMRK